MSLRDEIRELCLAHDKLMAEQASEPMRRPPASEIIYRDYDGGAQASASVADAEPLEGEAYPPVQTLLKSVAEATMMLIWRERDAFDRKLADLRAENAELKGMIGSVLMLLGQKSGNVTTVKKPESDVVELPNWRRGNAA